MMRIALLRALGITILTLGLGLGLFATTASAHADLASSNPPAATTLDHAPAEVVLTFTAEVEETTTIEVFGPDGSAVHAGAAVLDLNDPDRTRVSVALQPNLPSGVYTVNWVNFSTDGHSQDGSFTFTVRTGAIASPIASPEASPVVMTEDEVKSQMQMIAEQAQQQATLMAADEDPIDDLDFFLSVLAGVGAAIVIYLFWRKVRPSASERVQ